jgi:hypothetical protein
MKTVIRGPRRCPHCLKSIAYSGYSRHVKNRCKKRTTDAITTDAITTVGTFSKKKKSLKKTDNIPWVTQESQKSKLKNLLKEYFPNVLTLEKVLSLDKIDQISELAKRLALKRISKFASSGPHVGYTRTLSLLRKESRKDNVLTKELLTAHFGTKDHALLKLANKVSWSEANGLEVRLLKLCKQSERTGFSWIEARYELDLDKLERCIGIHRTSALIDKKVGWNPSIFLQGFTPAVIAIFGLPQLLQKKFYLHQGVLAFFYSTFYKAYPQPDSSTKRVWGSDDGFFNMTCGIESCLYNLVDEFEELLKEKMCRLDPPENFRDFETWFSSIFCDEKTTSKEAFNLFEAIWLTNETHGTGTSWLNFLIQKIGKKKVSQAYSKIKHGHLLNDGATTLEAGDSEFFIKQRVGMKTFSILFGRREGLESRTKMFGWFVKLWHNLVTTQQSKISCVSFS